MSESGANFGSTMQPTSDLKKPFKTAEELKNTDLRPINIRDMLINEEYLKGLSHIVKRG